MDRRKHNRTYLHFERRRFEHSVIYEVSVNGGEYEAFNGAKNAAVYQIRATIEEQADGNYQGQIFSAAMIIEPYRTQVVWDMPYGNHEFVYNGGDRSDAISATISLTPA